MARWSRVPPDRATLAQLVRNARRIAVVGLSPKAERPSHGVAAYLQRAGYRIIPVHPAGGVTLGEPVYPDLRSAAAAAGPHRHRQCLSSFGAHSRAAGCLARGEAAAGLAAAGHPARRRRPEPGGGGHRGGDGPLPGGGPPIPGGLMPVRMLARVGLLAGDRRLSHVALGPGDRGPGPPGLHRLRRSGRVERISGRSRRRRSSSPVPCGRYAWRWAGTSAPTLAVGFGGAYFPGEHFGFSGEGFLIGLGFEDPAARSSPPGRPRLRRPASPSRRPPSRPPRSSFPPARYSGSTAASSFSPYARGNAGLVFSNQSSLRTVGQFPGCRRDRVDLIIYSDDHDSRVEPRSRWAADLPRPWAEAISSAGKFGTISSACSGSPVPPACAGLRPAARAGLQASPQHYHRVRCGAGAAEGETVLKRGSGDAGTGARRWTAGGGPGGDPGGRGRHPLRWQAEGSGAGRRRADSRSAGPGHDGGPGRAALAGGQRRAMPLPGGPISVPCQRRPARLRRAGRHLYRGHRGAGTGGLRRLGHALRLRLADPEHSRKGWSTHDAMLPQSDGRRGVEPLCAAYGPACRDAIAASLAAGDLRAIGFHDRIRVGILPWSRCGLWRTRTSCSST